MLKATECAQYCMGGLAAINVRILLSPLWEAREEFLSEWQTGNNPETAFVEMRTQSAFCQTAIPPPWGLLGSRGCTAKNRAFPEPNSGWTNLNYTRDSIYPMKYSNRVRWEVLIGDEFEPEFQALHVDVQNEILALAILLGQFGPQLGRPRVDTLKDSRHANMKELRFEAQGGVWRVAFAFDPKRRAILLIAGDKSGGSEKRFYRELIRRADGRFDAHLGRVKQEQEKEKHKKKRK